MDEENTKRAKLEHWDDLKLIPKSRGSSVNRKTKNMITDANVDTSKILHKAWRHQVTDQKTEKNESLNLVEKVIFAVSCHDNKI